jgi:ubiquinone/menaquinone biosynthesis C-methylase UbiE
LPFADDAFDAVVSGLVLNFVPEPAQAVAEMTRVVRPDGVVAAYVWDYASALDEDRRTAVRERLCSQLPIAADGSIALTARAWAAIGGC